MTRSGDAPRWRDQAYTVHLGAGRFGRRQWVAGSFYVEPSCLLLCLSQQHVGSEGTHRRLRWDRPVVVGRQSPGDSEGAAAF